MPKPGDIFKNVSKNNNTEVFGNGTCPATNLNLTASKYYASLAFKALQDSANKPHNNSFISITKPL